MVCADDGLERLSTHHSLRHRCRPDVKRPAGSPHDKVSGGRSALPVTETADVVVGGGVNGASIAYALAARGVAQPRPPRDPRSSRRHRRLVPRHGVQRLRVQNRARRGGVHGRADRRRAREDGGHRGLQSPSVRGGEIARRTASVRTAEGSRRAIDLPAGSVYFDWTNAPSREDAMFKRVVTSESELRALMGTPSERAIKKESATVDEPAREFIGHSPFLLLATSNADGRCDVSPKGDAPGFVRVLDER